MGERELVRERAREPEALDLYEELFRLMNACLARAHTRVVIKAKDLPWEQSRQGLIKWYVHPSRKDQPLGNFLFFVQDIRTHTGRHRHQGGFGLFVVEGKGYTTIDGTRVDWEEGDLVLLPIKANGVEHQHFNREPGKPCKWLAFAVIPYLEAMGFEFVQIETSPDWRKREPEYTPERGHSHEPGEAQHH